MACKYNIEEEVYKCSKCGQCKSVCPVYLATKNEMFLPRGRYIVLNECFNGAKKLSEKFVNNLDVCLNCNACKNFCPSNIDAVKVNTVLKNKYKYKYSFFSFSFIYRFLLNILRLLSLIYKIFPFKSVFVNTFFDRLFDIKVKRKKIKTNGKNVIYFEGCVNKYINPTDKNASLNLLIESGYNVIRIVSDCCGYPYISDGNISEFKKNAEKIIKSVSKDVDLVVCSCDSCFETLNRFSDFVDNSYEFKSKLIRLDKLLNKKINDNNAVYFKPLIRDDDFISLKSIDKKGLCSGFENFFALKYPKYAEDILNNQFYNPDDIANKTIITTCQLSKLGLLNCICKIKSNTEVMSYSEYIYRNNSD